MKSIFPSERAIQRFDDIQRLIQFSFDYRALPDRSFGQRIRYMLLSLESFKRSPVFGIGEHPVIAATYSEVMRVGISNHSELADCLAQYGIIGGIVFSLFLASIYKKILSLSKSMNNRYHVKVIFGLYLLYSIMDMSISANLFYVLFIFFPMLFEDNIDTYGIR